jgi:hypothetical protein
VVLAGVAKEFVDLVEDIADHVMGTVNLAVDLVDIVHDAPAVTNRAHGVDIIVEIDLVVAVIIIDAEVVQDATNAKLIVNFVAQRADAIIDTEPFLEGVSELGTIMRKAPNCRWMSANSWQGSACTDLIRQLLMTIGERVLWVINIFLLPRVSKLYLDIFSFKSGPPQRRLPTRPWMTTGPT